MKKESQSRERTRIQTIAREYRNKGYRVTVEPHRGDLPEFLTGFRPDLIAFGDDETVIVEVKTHSSLSKAKYLSELAKALNGKPGWRLELIVTNPKGRSTVPDEAEPANQEVLERRLTDAEHLARVGQVDAAMLLAWSAAEGLLRLISEREGIYLGRRGPSYVIKQLYSLGLLSKEVYQLLDEGFRFRNSLIHGFSAPYLGTAPVMRFIDTTRGLIDEPFE